MVLPNAADRPVYILITSRNILHVRRKSLDLCMLKWLPGQRLHLDTAGLTSTSGPPGNK